MKISMYDLDNERKLNPEGRNGVKLYAPAILWRGHKKVMTIESFIKHAITKSTNDYYFLISSYIQCKYNILNKP